MKTKLAVAAALLAVLPLAAQAGQASRLNAQMSEPLAMASHDEGYTKGHSPVANGVTDIVADGGSAAMVDARMKLRALQQVTTDIAVTKRTQDPAREATTG